MTDFLAGYVLPPGAGVAGDPGLKASQQDQPAKLLLITVPGGIEDYFHQINNATADEERYQIGEQHSIRVVPE